MGTIFDSKIIYKDATLIDMDGFMVSGGKFYEVTKRIIDIVLATMVVIAGFPICILIALAIKVESKGPIFYSQKRYGKNKIIFYFVKFRTMIDDAEKETGPKWADEKDNRVTRVGDFLRKTHLDEFPQMINILKGEMSFVGPRPERPEFVEILEKEMPQWDLRHKVLPGFTGLAQIKFRYARTIEESKEKLKYDLYYLQHRSLLFDIKILFQTLLRYCFKINTMEKNI